MRLPDGRIADGGAIYLSGEGKVAETSSYMEARRLVDLANAAMRNGMAT